MDINNSIYTPLDPSKCEVRLLHVTVGEPTAGPLRCDLEIVSLLADPKPTYEAISYCWGEISGTEEIILNGHHIDAPASAVKALRRFRPSFGTRPLWIDALCINQGDIPERSQQVQFMHAVYGCSQRTLIYLGDADETTGHAIELVKFYSKNREYLIPPHVDSPNKVTDEVSTFTADDGRALWIFFSRSWFSRVWVLQEAALAKSAVCYCGSLEVSWRHVCRSGDPLNGKFGINTLRRLEDSVERTGWVSGLSLVVLGFHFLEPEQSYPPNSRLSYRLSLHELLLTGRFLGATDPRDHFYAFLGFIGHKGCEWKLPDWVRIDDSKTIDEVMRDATKADFYKSGDLTAFELLDMDFMSGSEEISWSPLWDLRDRGEGRTRQLLPSRERGICYQLDLDILHNDSSAGSIFLKGYCFNPIVFVLPEPPDVKFKQYHKAAPRATFARYLNDLIALLVKGNIERSLSSILRTMAAGYI